MHQVICPRCGTSNQYGNFCQTCRFPFRNTYQEKPKPLLIPGKKTGDEKVKITALACLAVVVAFFFFASLNMDSKKHTSTTSSSPPSSDIKTIGSTGRVLLAADEKAFSEMMNAAVNNDDKRLMRMGVDGQVFGVEAGTKVKVIEGGIGKTRVSIQEGIQSGRTGWLPSEMVR